MTWGYRRHRCTENNREFDTREGLVSYLKRMDPGALRFVKYWYIEENFEARDVLYDLVDGRFQNISAKDWLDDALDAVEDAFCSGDYDWKEDCIEGIYYKDDEEEESDEQIFLLKDEGVCHIGLDVEEIRHRP